MISMNNKKLPLLLAISLSLASCTNLAPDYQRPAVDLSERWVGVALQAQQSNDLVAHELGWREFFRDPRLQLLIETALTHNHDLRKAALNVELTEQKYGIQRSDRLPMVGLSASAKRQHNFGGRISEQYQVGVGLSNFELDFFGRVKNQSEAALNQYLQTQEARDAAQLSIINAVAKLYYRWRVASDLRDWAQRTLQSRRKSLQLIQLRFREGLASGTDVSVARSLIATAMSSYQEQVRGVQQAENAMATLIGQPIERLSLPPALPLSQQFPAQSLFAELPSEVLLHRPDIRQAEYGLKAANANIGAARASLYPRITLTGNLGYVSPELKHLFDSPTRMWSIGPALELPIFDAGKRKSHIKITELQQKIAVESYQSAVQSAFQEIADALIARQTLDKQYQAEAQGLKASNNTLRMVKVQVREGLANGLNLLEVERNDFGMRQKLLATQLQCLSNQVTLYTALGGGLSETNAASVANTAVEAEK